MNVQPDRSSLDRGDLAFRARVAVSIAFLLLGAGPGLWAVHIPIVQERLGISPAILGLALLVMAGGAVLAMPIMGWAVGHVGSRIPTAAGMMLYMATIPLPILAGNVPFFFVALFFFGLLMGGLDVVGNVQAAEVEVLRGKPTMSSFHAFYSIGALGGALVGALLIANGWGDGTGAAGVCVILLALGAMAAGNLLPSERPIEGAPRFALPSRAVLGLGILAFLCFAIEGAVTDWSALFLTDAKGATPEAAAYGYAAYAFAMAGFRLFGDPIVVRLGPKPVTVGGSLLCVLGLGIALAAPWPLVSALGFGLVGLGAANIVPVLFSAAARTPGVASGVGVSAVATLGYSGFLVFPPILGFAADLFGLSAAIGIVLLMSAAMAWLGARQNLPRADRQA
jgi:MFS family permease